MYRKILVTLDVSEADDVILDHIRPLAKSMGSEIMLLHVADGWAARMFGTDAVSPEVAADKEYLERRRKELEQEGLKVSAELAFGDPVAEIVRWVSEHQCDLIAMGTHGHRFLADVVLGETASNVQHRVNVPVLLLRAKPGGAGG